MVFKMKEYILRKIAVLKPWKSSRADRNANTNNIATQQAENDAREHKATPGETRVSLEVNASTPAIVSNNNNCQRQLRRPTAARRIKPVDQAGQGSRRGPLTSRANSSRMQAVRSRRLMKEFRDISRATRTNHHAPFHVELVNDCLSEWNVYLRKIDSSSELFEDMKQLDVAHIQLSLSFPDNFPFSPPFMRVVSPCIERGFVMEGGAICMELLTQKGWASAYTVEAIVTQFAASVVKGQGRIDQNSRKLKPFSRRLAESSFRGIIRTHEKYGWVTPPLSDG